MSLTDFEQLLIDIKQKRPVISRETGVDVDSPEYKAQRAESAKKYEVACQKAQDYIAAEMDTKGSEDPEIEEKRRLLNLVLR